jgi:single-strand DNA-binding protein
MVTGRLRQRSYETPQGERVTVIDLSVDEAGPSLRFATAKVTKATWGASSSDARGDRRPTQAAVPTPYREPAGAVASGAIPANGVASTEAQSEPPF